MSKLLLIFILIGGWFFWDKGLEGFVKGNFTHFQSNATYWLHSHTPDNK